MIEKTTTPPTIIVTGMHCSGTRQVAAMLAALSIRMGDHLSTADTRREADRFADDKFVRFHRQVLSRACPQSETGYSDWGWAERESLSENRFDDFSEQAGRLIKTRAHEQDSCGFEDPRASLFLNQWDKLIEKPRYILVYGFPWDVAEAMQWLWVDEFLNNPESAYRIWNFYNRKIRAFYVEHADRCLLVNINALPANIERFVFLLGKFEGRTIDVGLADVLASYSLKTIAGEDPLIDLAAMAWPESIDLLRELDGLADISGDGLWRPRPVKSRLLRSEVESSEPVTLSVITPCYNQGAYLIDAIASVERHAPPGCELVIVNDGSDDPRTLEILALLKQHNYFIFDQENGGPSAARNQAIRLARGRYILPLDNDNRIRSGFIEQAIEILDSSPQVGVVYGDRQDFGIYHKTQEIPEFDLLELLKDNFIDVCTVMRKQVWIDCGGFDAAFPPLEDWEFWIHAAELGWNFEHLSILAFDYRVRPRSISKVLDSIEVWDGFCKRIRAKHPDLYWRVALGRIEALKREVELLAAEVRDKNHQLQRLEAHQSLNSEEMVQESSGPGESITENREERTSVVGQMRNRYGRIKYRYLLPFYRLFGRGPTAKGPIGIDNDSSPTERS